MDKDTERLNELLKELKDTVDRNDELFHVEHFQKSTNRMQESGHLEKVKGIVPNKDILVSSWTIPCPICQASIVVGDKCSWAWFIIYQSKYKIKRLVKLHYSCLHQYMLQSKGEPLIYPREICSKQSK